VVMFQVEVFWVVTPYSGVAGYHTYHTTWRHNPEGLQKLAIP